MIISNKKREWKKKHTLLIRPRDVKSLGLFLVSGGVVAAAGVVRKGGWSWWAPGPSQLTSA